MGIRNSELKNELACWWACISICFISLKSKSPSNRTVNHAVLEPPQFCHGSGYASKVLRAFFSHVLKNTFSFHQKLLQLPYQHIWKLISMNIKRERTKTSPRKARPIIKLINNLQSKYSPLARSHLDSNKLQYKQA